MKEINSTLELLYHIASEQLLEFDYYYLYGYEEYSFNWQNDFIESKILQSNPSFNETLFRFFKHEIIRPNTDYYSQFWLTPIILDQTLCFKLIRTISSEDNTEEQTEGETLILHPEINDSMHDGISYYL